MPPEVRAQLETLFQEKGTGDPSKDAHVREEAERIMREHGIEPPKFEHEGNWERHEGMGPSEAPHPADRETMERYHEMMERGEMSHEHQREYEAVRESFERETPTTYEAPQQRETPEYHAPEYEMPR